MNWYYAKDNQRQGPIPEAQLKDLVNRGSLDSETLLWHEGLATWTPLEQLRAEILGAKASGHASSEAGESAACAECGQLYPLGELATVNSLHICAACKPAFLVKLSSGRAFGGAVGLWKRRGQLVVSLDAPLPDRCVKCNATASSPHLKRQLYWHRSALYLLIIFPGVLIYAIVAMCVRKKATLFVGLCQRHRSRRKMTILLAWLLAATSVGLFIFGVYMVDKSIGGFCILGGILLLLASIIWGVYGARIVYAKKIDETHAFLGGACPEYLDALPDWPKL